jgi:hypothetical protein
MTDERFVCLDGTPARMTPQAATDDAVEAMAAKLRAELFRQRGLFLEIDCEHGDDDGAMLLDGVIDIRAIARVALDQIPRIAALEAVAEAVLDRASIEDDPRLIRAAAAALGRGEKTRG